MRMRDQGDAARAPFGTIDGAFDAAGRTGHELTAGARPHLHPQAFDDAAVPQVLLDDLVDVGLVDIGVPDRVRVDDDAGTLLAAIEAARLVDAHLAFTGHAERLDAALGVVAHGRGALVVAAGAL